MSKRDDILKEARQIVCNDRNVQYGEPEDNFACIAEFWSVYTGLELKSYDVALMMVLFKMARLISGSYKHDSVVDLIGYAACAEDCEEE